MDDRVNQCVRISVISDCDRACADFVKLDDAAPIHAPAYVSGGGGSVGMLRVMWPVSPVVLQSTKNSPKDLFKVCTHAAGHVAKSSVVLQSTVIHQRTILAMLLPPAWRCACMFVQVTGFFDLCRKYEVAKKFHVPVAAPCPRP